MYFKCDLLSAISIYLFLHNLLCVCVPIEWFLCVHMCVDIRGIGVVAGAVVGVSFGILLIILIIWLVCRNKEMKKYEEEETPNEIRYVIERNNICQS